MYTSNCYYMHCEHKKYKYKYLVWITAQPVKMWWYIEKNKNMTRLYKSCIFRYHAVRSNTILCHLVSSHTILYHFLPSCTILYHPAPSCTILYHFEPSCTILYYPAPSRTPPLTYRIALVGRIRFVECAKSHSRIGQVGLVSQVAVRTFASVGSVRRLRSAGLGAV